MLQSAMNSRCRVLLRLLLDPGNYRNVGSARVGDEALRFPAGIVHDLLHLVSRYQQVIEPESDAIAVTPSDSNLARHPSAPSVRATRVAVQPEWSRICRIAVGSSLKDM